jgi:hypothetical protein
MTADMRILLHASHHVLFHINCFMHFFIFGGLPQKGEQTGLLDVTISGMKHAWLQKSTLRTPFHIQLYLCCTINMGFTEN